MDDPFLIDKMRGEKEGILLWALEGLHRLIQNNYQFTISERTAANLKEAMEQGNNILGFLKSEGYFEIRQGAKCKSTDFYKVYERWCLDNLEKPLAASTFIHHLKDNQKSLGIVYDDKCIGTNRGFHNVDVDLFLPVDVPSPMNKSRPVATETVKSLDYTKNILQTIPNNDKMEVVTQTNAVKSPTDSLKATTLVYTVEEIAQMLSISLRSAYNLCNSTTEFRVLRVGGSIRIPKDSFDAWLRAA